jgi:hypothetical protein
MYTAVPITALTRLLRTRSTRSGVSSIQCFRQWHHTAANPSNAAYCGIDGAEPLHRYKPGGYHPVHLGECFNFGRYQILHKLGWGGWATVWLAKDHRSVLFSGVRKVCLYFDAWLLS